MSVRGSVEKDDLANCLTFSQSVESFVDSLSLPSDRELFDPAILEQRGDLILADASEMLGLSVFGEGLGRDIAFHNEDLSRL